jgi:hypothetical protein
MSPRARALASLIAAILVAAAPARAGESADPRTIGLLPTEKTASPVDEGERNPFSRHEQQKSAEPVADVESEESKIRAAFAKLAVTGATRGPGARKALLGPFIVRPGARLPPVIEGQTESLICTAIDDTTIEISFIERSDLVEPRKIQIRYDLTPSVSVLVGGEGAPQPSKPGSATNAIRATPLKSAVKADEPPGT